MDKKFKNITELPKAEMFDVQDIEIFAEGTWNGDVYKTEDLDEMVRAFNEVGHLTQPIVKIGHSEKQKLLAEDELPSAGLVKNLRRIGEKLLADFVNVPKKVAQVIRNKAFSRVSSEIFWNINVLGKKFPRMLKAVSILGGAMPAVVTLDDILKLNAAHGAAGAYNSDAEVKVCEIDGPNNQEENAMDIKELEKKLAEAEKNFADAEAKFAELEAKYQKDDDDEKDKMPFLKKRLKELENENTALKKKLEQLTKKNEEMESTVKDNEWKARETEVKAEIDSFVKDEKINPVQRDALTGLMLHASFDSETKSYKLGDKEYTVSGLLKVFIEGGQAELNTDGNSQKGARQSGDIHDRALKYAEEHKVSYKEALIELSPNNN